MNTSPLALLNSQIASEGDVLTNTPSKSLPVEDAGGLKTRVRLLSEVELPEIHFEVIDSKSATLIADNEEIPVQPSEEEVVELDSQTVEIEVPGDIVKETEFTRAEDEELPEDQSPKTVFVRETEVEEITVTPSVRVAHHGKGNMYGVENGVALPLDDSHPMARRAMEVSQINAAVDRGNSEIGTNSASGAKDVLIIHRGKTNGSHN